LKTPCTLRVPSLDILPGYVDALNRGWSPDNVRGREVADAHLEAIAENAVGFVDSLGDEDSGGGTIALPDGSTVPRLPGFRRWIWDGEFCGTIGLIWQPGSSELPSHVLGHIGFAVVPWKRGHGHAKRALALILPEARQRGLDRVEITTDVGNDASQKVILSNDGWLVERFLKPAAFGGTEALRYRIAL